MANFQEALKKVLRHEGVEFNSRGEITNIGYVNHADDPGGETAYGITRRVALKHGYDGPMEEIPFATVEKIYRVDYWNKIQGDIVKDQEIAEELFDTAVNIGYEAVAIFLQRALNALNKKATVYPDIKVDGVCGPVTISTLNDSLRLKYQKRCLIWLLTSLQGVYYLKLAEQDEKFETFVPGWILNRVKMVDWD